MNRFSRRSHKSTGIAVAGIAVAIAGASMVSVATAETLKLTVIAAPPPIVTPVATTKNFFIPEVDKRLAASGKDFKIEWREAYSGSLATFPEVFEAVEEGIGDVGILLRNFEEAKLPLDQYTTVMPFGINDPVELVLADRDIRKAVPEINQNYGKFNQVFLAGAPSLSLQLFTNFPVTKLDDLKGRKIGASGALGQIFRGTGAVIVTASMQQAVTDIKNGLYDGYQISIPLAFPFKTYEAAKFYTVTNFGANLPPALSVNKDVWDKLPEHAQKIMLEVANEWSIVHAKTDLGKKEKFSGILKKKGVEFATFPEAERAKWAAQIPNLAQEWIKAMDAKGLGAPAKKIVGLYMDEVRARDAQVLRDWSKN